MSESPWKTLSRERWDAEYGEGDFDRRLSDAAEDEFNRLHPRSAMYIDPAKMQVAPEGCRVYWGSHGCQLKRGHDGHCECECCSCENHPDHPSCVGKYPHYGDDTLYYGEDAAARGLPMVDAE